MKETLRQDISAVPEENRQEFLNGKTGEISDMLKETYPESEGYTFTESHITPFDERKDIKGKALGVRKGRYWGYTIAVIPDDFQIRSMRVEIKDNLAFYDTLILSSFVAGVICSIAAAVFVLVKGTSDYRDYILAGFAGLPVGVILFLVLKALTKSKIQKLNSPEQMKQEISRIADAIAGVLS